MWLSVRTGLIYDQHGDGPECDRAIIRWTREWAGMMLNHAAELARMQKVFSGNLRDVTLSVPNGQLWLCRFTELWDELTTSRAIPEKGPILHTCTTGNADQLVLPDHFTLESVTPEGEPLSAYVADRVERKLLVMVLPGSGNTGLRAIYYRCVAAGEPIETGLIDLALLKRVAGVKMF